MRGGNRAVGTMAAVILAVAVWSVPAHATVHEIVAQWCSGHEPLEPAGLSRPGSKNFAQPLNAARVVIEIVDPIAKTVFVTFDYDHPAIKVRSTGQRIQIGTTPEGFTVFLDVIEPDPNFPAFRHCPGLGF